MNAAYDVPMKVRKEWVYEAMSDPSAHTFDCPDCGAVNEVRAVKCRTCGWATDPKEVADALRHRRGRKLD